MFFQKVAALAAGPLLGSPAPTRPWWSTGLTAVWNGRNGGTVWRYRQRLFLRPGGDAGGLSGHGRLQFPGGDLQGLNRGSSDAVLAQYTARGGLLWNENFGGSSFDAFCAILPGGVGYWAAGYSASRDQQLTGLNYGRQDAILTGLRVPFAARVRYSPTGPTAGPVTATLTATEPIEMPPGWTRINDTTFTEEYTRNTTEEVTLKALADPKEVTLTVSVTNITPNSRDLFWVWLLAAAFLLALLLLFLCCGC